VGVLVGVLVDVRVLGVGYCQVEVRVRVLLAWTVGVPGGVVGIGWYWCWLGVVGGDVGVLVLVWSVSIGGSVGRCGAWSTSWFGRPPTVLTVVERCIRLPLLGSLIHVCARSGTRPGGAHQVTVGPGVSSRMAHLGLR